MSKKNFDDVMKMLKEVPGVTKHLQNTKHENIIWSPFVEDDKEYDELYKNHIKDDEE